MLARVLIQRRPEYPWQALHAGLRRLGYDVVEQVHPPQHDEVLVTWTPWKGTVVDRFGESHRQAGGRWIVLEHGYLSSLRHGERYYSVGLNGVNGFGQHRNFMSLGDRFEALGRPLQPWQAGEHIVLIAQREGTDTRYMMPPGWLDDVVEQLRQATNRPIHYVPKRQRPVYFRYRHDGVVLRDEPLADVLRGAHACVVYNSKAGVEALHAGVPVLTDHTSILTEISGVVGEAEYPPRPERLPFFHDLAYAQWNTSEIETGEPLARLLGPA